MSRLSLKRAVAYDQSTGQKVAAQKLRRDPNTQLFTVDPDKPNPRLYTGPLADGAGRRHGLAPRDSFSPTVLVGYGGIDDYAPTPHLAVQTDLSTRYALETLQPINVSIDVTPLAELDLYVASASLQRYVTDLAIDITPPSMAVVINASTSAWGLGGWGVDAWGGAV